MSLVLLLRGAGASLIFLSILHAVLWRTLHWDSESERLSPLNARVFAVHTFFIAYVLLALGMLSLARPELLLERGELARVLLGGVVLFWVARLLLQPLVFDRVMRSGWTQSILLRVSVALLWATYVTIYGILLLRQFGAFAG